MVAWLLPNARVIDLHRNDRDRFTEMQGPAMIDADPSVRVGPQRDISALITHGQIIWGLFGHSGSPAFRMPSEYLAMSFDRRSGVRSLRLEIRKAGSICRRRATGFWTCSILPAKALAVA
jgi:hypothetical protein